MAVHQNVLSAHSPVFAALLNRQNENRVLVIGGTKVDTFEMLLRYIYTGLVPALDQLGPEIFVAADKYQLESLRALAEDHLCGSLTVDCVVERLLLADQHSASKLKQSSTKFITEHAREVMGTPAWELMGQKRPLLLMQLYKDLVGVKK